MSELLLDTSDSLIHQSFGAREREEPLNGDGFGVGWYQQAMDPTPGLFTSVQPAWSNRNLIRLAPKIRSSCFFAHVRAASSGSPVNELNCHPFQFGCLLWMHNGRLAGFRRLKRQIRQHIRDEVYHNILGTTDSEHVFGLFLTELYEHLSDYSIDDLAKAMRSTIQRLERWSAGRSIDDQSDMNFAVTDGYNVLVTRYSANARRAPQTLYIAQGERLEVVDGEYRMIKGGARVNSVVVASEPLTDAADDWQPVPGNHMVTVSPQMHVRIEPF